MSWDPLCSERQGADTGELKVLSKDYLWKMKLVVYLHFHSLYYLFPNVLCMYVVLHLCQV